MSNPETRLEHLSRGVILVGHGGVPTDYPIHMVRKLKQLESQRRATGNHITTEEQKLDTQIRQWPRTPKTDPYQAGLESLGAHLKPLLKNSMFALAYNEFCTPTVEEAVISLIAKGRNDLTIISSMLTPGGSHAEIEIPETLKQLRTHHPNIIIRYAWPFDLSQIAKLLASHIQDAQ
tara:strand:- start:5600 stop:6130 length:531 start_codon:yes stop_codon:yes gene_type:complete